MAWQKKAPAKPVTSAKDFAKFKRASDEIIERTNRADWTGMNLAGDIFVRMLDLEIHDGKAFSEFLQNTIIKTGILIGATGAKEGEAITSALREVYSKGTQR